MSNSKHKSTMIKDALILCVITLVAGFLLGFIYDVTADKRAKAEQDAKNDAYKLIFKDATSFEDATDFADDVKNSESYFKGEGYSSGDVSYDFTGITVDELVEAKNEDTLYGYIVTVTTPNGYGGDIQIALGIDIDGTVVGTQILSIDETPGLGMNAKGDFKDQFTGKNVEGFVHTKNGKSADNEIDAITSATITTKAVTGAVDAGLLFVRDVVLDIK